MALIKATKPETKLQKFTVTYYISHAYTCEVEAEDYEAALEVAESGDFVDEGADDMGPSLITVTDEEGDQVYEELP